MNLRTSFCSALLLISFTSNAQLTDYKARVDSTITNVTATRSITPTIVGNRMTELADIVDTTKLSIADSTTKYVTPSQMASSISASAISGTYTPTLTGLLNIAEEPEPEQWRYMLVGRMVIVFGSVIATCEGDGETGLSFTIPHGIEFLNEYSLTGSGTVVASSVYGAVEIKSNFSIGEGEIWFIGDSDTTNYIRFSFSYQIN